MRAEQAVTKVSRDYIRYARKMAEIKNSMDRAQELFEAREEAAVEGRAEGLEKGLQEGLAEGLQKGLTEGLEKGRANEKLEIARNMIKMGLPVETIVSATQLDPEKVKTLTVNIGTGDQGLGRKQLTVKK
jgi:predicted transposase/invertase (TIGR01784 family)